jgi:hypothetical protein
MQRLDWCNVSGGLGPGAAFRGLSLKDNDTLAFAMSGTICNVPRLFRAVVYPRNTAIVREQNGDLSRLVVWA